MGFLEVELGLSNGWAKAWKSEIPKLAFILVSSAVAARARHLPRCPCLGGYETGWLGPSGSGRRATNGNFPINFPWALPLYFGPEIH
ncbi:hypothetical protein PIB30_006574 [Stylosanthes scabra]|uniref:Uncharacterized protein n=1 Tax=Stylosanthes scabra TaxID=79078 RepID=A0ABU6Y609_9FABA|nr:hypothetical protein [Stylosanthes scabra]